MIKFSYWTFEISAPTVDEVVLTSLNNIGNLLLTHRPVNKNIDVLFDVAIKLGVFESIFQWNFIFSGSDLESFKAKELQFYDSLISGSGWYYLHYASVSSTE